MLARHCKQAFLIVGSFLLMHVLGTSATAQLITDELLLVPGTISSGAGTVRLDGMGGFKISVADENREINLWDYSANPAGYGDDRDSWVVDLRFSHRERALRDLDLTPGNDIRQNFGTFIMGFYAPGDLGVGGFVDYVEAQGQDPTAFTDFRVVGFGLRANKYLTKKFSVGLNLTSTGLDQERSSNEIYAISHTGSVYRGSLGLAYILLEGVQLGVRGDYIGTTVDGEARSSFHADQFTWDRPGYLGSGHLFVDRGRLQGVVDYTKQTQEGSEKVNLSWSQRYILNPTPGEIAGEFDTFSEDRNTDVFSTRWMLSVVPKTLDISVAYASTQRDFKVITNPNVLGSLTSGQVDGSGSTVLGGLSLTTLKKRLLVAGEVGVSSATREDFTNQVVEESGAKSGAIRNELDELSLRVGAEYLFGESFAGRLGFVQTSSTLKFLTTANYPEFVETDSNDFNTSVLTTGVGLVPRGAIWQLDFAYDAVISSDLDTDDERFSVYLRYLF